MPTGSGGALPRLGSPTSASRAGRCRARIPRGHPGEPEARRRHNNLAAICLFQPAASRRRDRDEAGEKNGFRVNSQFKADLKARSRSPDDEEPDHEHEEHSTCRTDAPAGADVSRRGGWLAANACAVVPRAGGGPRRSPRATCPAVRQPIRESSPRLLCWLARAGRCRLLPAARAASIAGSDAARWRQHAERVTITRDDWGIPQWPARPTPTRSSAWSTRSEDDFNRIETNYLSAMGRPGRGRRGKAISRDLRMKLFVDPAQMQAHYESSPVWLRALMTHGRRLELLPGNASRRHSARDSAVRAVDGADVHEGTSGTTSKPSGWRISRPSTDSRTPGRRPRPCSTRDRPSRRGRTHRHRTREHGRASCPAADQPPHLVLLPRRGAGGEREGLNAYGAVTWGQFFVYQGSTSAPAGCTRRAAWTRSTSTRDDRQEGRRAVLPLRRRKSEPVTKTTVVGALQDQRGLGRRRSPSTAPPRPHRPRGRRRVGEREAHAGAREGADAVLSRMKATATGPSADAGPAHELVQQHGLRRRRREHRLLPRQFHPET